jgi:hypothetical protein
MQVRTFLTPPAFFLPLKQRIHRHRRHKIKLSLAGALKIKRIKQFLCNLCGGITIQQKFKIANRFGQFSVFRIFSPK